MKEAVAIVTEDASGALIVQERFKDARDARKALASCEPGVYHIVRFVEHGVEVSPPPPQSNVVTGGTKFVTRARKE